MTVYAIRLISSVGEGQIAEWRPDDGRIINVVSANDQQAICSCGHQLFYFELGERRLSLMRY